MKERLDDYSVREKNLWFEFLVDVAVALYYWPNALGLMLRGDDALRGGAMVGLITSTVIWAIVVSGALSIFLHMQQKPEPKDERDYIIDARSSVFGSRVLIACLFVIIGQIVIQEIPGPYTSHFEFFTLSPLVMAHMLLVALMLWSMTTTIAKLYFYRKGA